MPLHRKRILVVQETGVSSPLKVKERITHVAAVRLRTSDPHARRGARAHCVRCKSKCDSIVSGAVWGCSTSGWLKSRTKRSLRANASSGTSPRPPTCSPRRDSAQKEAWSDTISGRATGLSARSGGQVLKQERVPKRRHSDTAWMVLTKLRVNLGLTIATMAE